MTTVPVRNEIWYRVALRMTPDKLLALHERSPSAILFIKGGIQVWMDKAKQDFGVDNATFLRDLDNSIEKYRTYYYTYTIVNFLHDLYKLASIGSGDTKEFIDSYIDVLCKYISSEPGIKTIIDKIESCDLYLMPDDFNKQTIDGNYKFVGVPLVINNKLYICVATKTDSIMKLLTSTEKGSPLWNYRIKSIAAMSLNILGRTPSDSEMAFARALPKQNITLQLQ